ncbi:MAG: 1-acyl-sn-glycerol-3-phosphate acyltransferase [Acidimicrobiales bacterium]
MSKAWVRRPIVVFGVFFGALFLTIFSPIWLLVTLLFDVASAKRRMPTLRLIGFAWCWLWLELIGITVAAVLWVTGQASNQRANYALQRWWAKKLIGSLRVTCGFKITVKGVDALPEGPLVCLGRHASLGDALVSAWIFGSLAHRFPRYVMKRELLLDPCLDVVGQRIPNYFVDRGSAAIRQEIAGIQAMASGMSTHDVAVIFPEGTRTNDEKRNALVSRLERRSPDRYRKMLALQRLLPPRSAGATALLGEVSEADVVILWHVGFDGLDTFKGIRRRLADAAPQALVVLESHERASVPEGLEFESWLDDRWVEIDAKVVAADSV